MHHHLQSVSLYAFFLTETKFKPPDPNDSIILSLHLNCPGYELFSSFFPKGRFCTFIRSHVQTLRLKQFDLTNPSFQLIWLRFSLPQTANYMCTVYHPPSSNNQEVLFNYLFKSIEAIT